MVPSPSNPSPPDNQAPSSRSAQSQASDVSDRETEQMFRLIDSILPFEACLYYQFVPLCLEGRHLKLGMVAPQDPSALGYVRHILAYLNCSLKTEQIDAEEHRSLLSAYLSHTHKSSSAQQQASQNHSQTPAQSEQPPAILEESAALEEPTAPPSESYHPTDLVPISTKASVALTQALQLSSESPLIEPQEQEISTSEMDLTSEPEAPPSSDTVPPLQVNALYLSRPIEFLGTLAAPQLLQELLGRVLIGGIGRLYFERQPNQGRILWSQDGVLQSVLEGLSLRTFQGVILELKRLVNLSLIPVTQPKHVEIERRYQQEELLLRLRVMPGTHGEEATLQVLRGAALKFYQRQQLEKLGQDALKLAQQLQRKLTEIRIRANRNPVPLEALPALNQMMEGLDRQMEALVELQINQDSDNPTS